MNERLVKRLRLRQQVGDHHGTLHVLERDHAARNERDRARTRQRLGGSAHHMLRVLEGHRVESHVHGRLGVALDDARPIKRDAEVEEQLASEHVCVQSLP